MREIVLEPGQLFDYRISNQKHAEMHDHRALELLYVLEGKIQLEIGEEHFVLHERDMVTINSAVEHKLSTDEDVLYASFYVDYTELLNQMYASRILFLCNSSIDDRNRYQILEDQVKSILKMSYEKDFTEMVGLNRAYYQLIELLIREFSVVYGLDDPSARVQSRREEIERYIQAHYSRNLSLNDLADYLYLSPPYTSKMFKELFGKTFYKYLNDIRLTQAHTELIGTNHSMTTIAMNSGFPNVSAFNKLFKERYATTPNEYRSRNNLFNKKVDQGQSMNWQDRLKRILQEDPLAIAPDSETSVMLDVSIAEPPEFFKYWAQVINLNQAEVLKNVSADEQVMMLKENLGFEYGRIWNIFSKEMKTFDSAGRLNFFYLERIFDFLMTKKIKPFIVLNPTDDLTNLKIDSSLNTDIQTSEFIEIFRAFVAYAVNRYGLKQVQEWRFEVLFRPEKGKMNERLFFSIFTSLKESLFQLSSHFKIGGAGLSVHIGAEPLRDFLSKWLQQRQQPDFLTLHADSRILEETGTRSMIDTRYIRNQVLMVKNVLKETGHRLDDIQISNWNLDMVYQKFLNDSSYKAAYLVKNIIDCYGLLQALGYDQALDMLLPSTDAPTLLHGSPGLLSRQGLKKPSYYAYSFLNIGNAKYFLGKNEYSMMTGDGADNWFIVCHNCGTPNPRYFTDHSQINEFASYDEIFDVEGTKCLKFRIRDARNGLYKIKIRLVNEHSGNVRQEWIGLNGGGELSNSEIDYLRQISIPQMTIQLVEVTNGVLELVTQLERNEIKSIRIAYQY